MGVPFSSAFAIHGYIGWLYCLHLVMFRSMVRQLIRFGYMVGCSWLYWFVLFVIFLFGGEIVRGFMWLIGSLTGCMACWLVLSKKLRQPRFKIQINSIKLNQSD